VAAIQRMNAAACDGNWAACGRQMFPKKKKKTQEGQEEDE